MDRRSHIPNGGSFETARSTLGALLLHQNRAARSRGGPMVRIPFAPAESQQQTGGCNHETEQPLAAELCDNRLCVARHPTLVPPAEPEDYPRLKRSAFPHDGSRVTLRYGIGRCHPLWAKNCACAPLVSSRLFSRCRCCCPPMPSARRLVMLGWASPPSDYWSSTAGAMSGECGTCRVSSGTSSSFRRSTRSSSYVPAARWLTSSCRSFIRSSNSPFRKSSRSSETPTCCANRADRKRSTGSRRRSIRSTRIYRAGVLPARFGSAVTAFL